MGKKWICFAVCLAASLSLFAASAYAATPGARIHSNAIDTDDYCLSVSDVTIGLAEINGYTDDTALHSAILSAAVPTVLVRDKSIDSSQWRVLSIAELSVDFTAFQSASAGVYPVTITAPAITPGLVSSISFNVYVENDVIIPIYAKIVFYGTELPEQYVDITYGASVSLADLSTPNKENYKFLGWYSDEALTAPFLLAGDASSQPVTGDMTLFPAWEAIVVEPTPTPDPTPTPTPTPTSTPTFTPASVVPDPVLPSGVYDPVPPPTERPTLTPRPTISPMSENAPLPTVKPVPSPTAPTETAVDEPPYNGKLDTMVMTALGSAVAIMSTSITSDLRVIAWYEKKKQERKMKK